MRKSSSEGDVHWRVKILQASLYIPFMNLYVPTSFSILCISSIFNHPSKKLFVHLHAKSISILKPLPILHPADLSSGSIFHEVGSIAHVVVENLHAGWNETTAFTSLSLSFLTSSSAIIKKNSYKTITV